MPKQHGARPADTGSQDVTPSSYADLGLQKMEVNRAQRLAAIPEDTLRSAIETAKEAGEVSIAAVMKAVKQEHSESDTVPTTALPVDARGQATGGRAERRGRGSLLLTKGDMPPRFLNFEA